MGIRHLGDIHHRPGELQVRKMRELEGVAPPGADLYRPGLRLVAVVIASQVGRDVLGERVEQQLAMVVPILHRRVLVLRIGKNQEPGDGPLKGYPGTEVPAQYGLAGVASKRREVAVGAAEVDDAD